MTARRKIELAANFPTIVCLCGSSRFYDEFQQVNARETLAGKIVLSIATLAANESDYFAQLSQQESERLKIVFDDLHKCKIELADEVLIINKDGYIGESTKGELEYAQSLGKKIRWLEPM